jgi:hypothetical protein
MIRNVAIITSLFDYPSHYLPLFYKNALKYFDEKDIHIVRNNGLVTNGSYYDKLYFYKIPKVLEYIKEKILGNYDYILFLDATDTNFYSSPNNIIDLFLSKNCSIIFGAEKGLWPNTSYTHLYESKNINSEYKYLNSGTYFGFTEKIIKHMETIIDKGYENGIDDQGKWTIEYLLSNDIIIDYNCEFFMSSFESKKYFEIENNKVKLLLYNPIVIHDNGPHNDNTIKVTNLL